MLDVLLNNEEVFFPEINWLIQKNRKMNGIFFSAFLMKVLPSQYLPVESHQ